MRPPLTATARARACRRSCVTIVPPLSSTSACIAANAICDSVYKVGSVAEREKALLIIDGDNLAHRAYHSMPKSLRSDDGRPINAIVGWTNMLLTLWDSQQPRSVFV